jgi:hypothetical protein
MVHHSGRGSVGVGVGSRLFSWRALRWLGVAPLLPALWACADRSVAEPQPNPQIIVDRVFPASLNPKLDLLFMVDNSLSMQPLQAKLLDQFPAFMDRLKIIPTADGKGTGLPDVHVAVVSSDTGPGVFDLPPETHCRFKGDNGHFQFEPRGACTTSPLHAQQTFLTASTNETVKNYDGDIRDAFKCIAALGDGGCGFEGQLKSVRLALDPAALPDTNAGFLREDAFLAVILITNEDDCSVPDDSQLFNSKQTLMSDPLGPFSSFRCNEFGHLCNINGTLQPPPRGPADNLSGCVSNESDTGRLTKVADEVAFLRSIKHDPDNQILVAAITGIPRDGQYSIGMIQANGDPELHPNIKPACTNAAGESADPSVRIAQWVQSFGKNGLMQSICANDFALSLKTIADALTVRLQPACVRGTLVDRDPNTPDLQAECQVMDRDLSTAGKVTEATIHACASDATPPCWSLKVDAAKCGEDHVLEVTRAPGPLSDNLRTVISCATCIPGVTRAGCP